MHIHAQSKALQSRAIHSNVRSVVPCFRNPPPPPTPPHPPVILEEQIETGIFYVFHSDQARITRYFTYFIAIRHAYHGILRISKRSATHNTVFYVFSNIFGAKTGTHNTVFDVFQSDQARITRYFAYFRAIRHA